MGREMRLRGMIKLPIARFGLSWAIIIAIWHALVPTSVCADTFAISDKTRTLILANRFAEAEQSVREQAKGEGKPVSLALIGWLRIRQGQEEDGIRLIREAKGIGEAGWDVGQLVGLAEVVGDASAAAGISLLESSLESGSVASQSQVWVALLDLYSKSKDPEAGEQVAREVLARVVAPEDLVGPIYRYSVSLYEDGSAKLALEMYEQLRERAPVTQVDPGYQLQYAHLLSAGGKPLEALAVIDGIRSAYRDYTRANEVLLSMASAIAYEQAGDRESAAQEYKAIVASNQKHPLAAVATDKLRNFDEDAQAAVTAGPGVARPNAGASWRAAGFIGANVLVAVAAACFMLRRRFAAGES